MLKASDIFKPGCLPKAFKIDPNNLRVQIQILETQEKQKKLMSLKNQPIENLRITI